MEEFYNLQGRVDYSRPVAYDADGHPLYAAPFTMESPSEKQPAQVTQYTPRSYITNAKDGYDGENFNPKLRTQYANSPHMVHATRHHHPDKFTISDALRNKHDESMQLYPDLNLSEAEYVILNVKRHPIGLLLPMAMSVSIVVLLFVGLLGYPLIKDTLGSYMPDMPAAGLLLLALIALAGLGGYVAVWVYLRNTFYLTNETVIQELQYSLFARHEQTVSLGSIEDVSYIQRGVLPTLLNYGEIRLSTEGEETTYRFRYVANPKAQVTHINNAVEAFKNGRPVGDLYDD